MASHNQPDPPAQPLPGDIVQVTDRASSHYMELLTVETVRPTFTGGFFQVRGPDGDIELDYVRVRSGQYEKVGTAALVSADIAAARRNAAQTARELAKESKEGEE
jgi:hypothetical protein